MRGKLKDRNNALEFRLFLALGQSRAGKEQESMGPEKVNQPSLGTKL
jgi:hypothetical protein